MKLYSTPTPTLTLTPNPKPNFRISYVATNADTTEFALVNCLTKLRLLEINIRMPAQATAPKCCDYQQLHSRARQIYCTP